MKDTILILLRLHMLSKALGNVDNHAHSSLSKNEQRGPRSNCFSQRATRTGEPHSCLDIQVLKPVEYGIVFTGMIDIHCSYS